MCVCVCLCVCVCVCVCVFPLVCVRFMFYLTLISVYVQNSFPSFEVACSRWFDKLALFKIYFDYIGIGVSKHFFLLSSILILLLCSDFLVLSVCVDLMYVSLHLLHSIM